MAGLAAANLGAPPALHPDGSKHRLKTSNTAAALSLLSRLSTAAAQQRQLRQQEAALAGTEPAAQTPFPGPNTSGALPSSPCSLPPAAGDCRASLPRWFWSASTGGCEEFLYGGCGGNANNFPTKAVCQEACKPGMPLSAREMPTATISVLPSPMRFGSSPNREEGNGTAQQATGNAAGWGRCRGSCAAVAAGTAVAAVLAALL
jgi:hypothetical protein